MDQKRFESLGAIAMPEEGHYVVHPENLPAVLSAALDFEATARIVGRTSTNPGAAFIVEVIRDRTENARDFFTDVQGRAGLSQALMDVVQRRS